jgi:pyrimidine deaminase RibD-like protein
MEVSPSDIHLERLSLALREAEKCIPTPTAFCVGCVLAATWPPDSGSAAIIATAYSRELPGNTHAEANALTKARNLTQSDIAALFPSLDILPSIDELLHQADIYTTMEPCSIRTSGLPPCAGALSDAQIKRCYIGVGEPDDFVTCEGARKLKEAGIEVIWMKGIEDECLRVARRGHSNLKS